MKKNIQLTVAILLAFNFGLSTANAQAPEQINYQAVARDLSGNPLVSTAINIEFTIRQGTATGTIVYSETQTDTTNQFGLFNMAIGAGTPAPGTLFSSINWSTGLYYLQVTINGEVMPATQLLSVPFALHANTAATGQQGFNSLIDTIGVTLAACPNGGYMIRAGLDTNANTVLDVGEITSSFVVCNGLNGVATPSLDNDTTNEIQTLSISNDTIFLSDGGFIPLPAALGDNWGVDVVNTSGANISGNGTVGNPLVVIDNDNDSTNELVTAFWEDGTDLILTEGGTTRTIALSNLAGNDWSLSGNTGTTPGTNFLGTTDAQDLVFSTNSIERMRINAIGNVGIGTNNPLGSLHLVKEGAVNILGIETSGGSDSKIILMASEGTIAAPTPTLANGTLGVIEFNGHDGSNYDQGADIIVSSFGNFGISQASTMQFRTDNGTNFAARMTIDEVGNVGIGTSAPLGRTHTHIISPLVPALVVTNGNTTANDAAIVQFDANSSLTNAFRLERDGQVGIGAGTATATLHLDGTLRLDNLGSTFTTGAVLTAIDALGNAEWQPFPVGLWTQGVGTLYPTTLTDSVGIGTNTPNSKLHISGSYSNVGTQGTFFDLQNTFGSNTSSAKVGIRFKTSNYPNGQHIKGGIIYARTSSNARGDIHFLNNSNDDISEIDITTDTKMIIKNSGNVGIGTVNPIFSFHVETADQDRAGYFINTTNSATGKIGLYGIASGSGSGDNIGGWFDASGTGTGINYGVAGQALGTGGTENRGVYGAAAGAPINWAGYFEAGDVYIQNDLGIGTTTPSEKLTVDNGNIQIFRDDGADVNVILNGGDNGITWTLGNEDSDAGYFKIATSNNLSTNTRFTITDAGDIAIGIANINVKATIYDANEPTLRLTNSPNAGFINNVNSGKIEFFESNGVVGTDPTYGFDIGYNGITNNFEINSHYNTIINNAITIERGTGTLAQVQIGIGTTAPTSKLEVNGTVTISGTNQELNRVETGAANLVPIAYGNISSSAAINIGTGNFSVTWDATNSWYVITIVGESYNWTQYMTSVTPLTVGSTPLSAVTNSVSGDLIVEIYDGSTGNRVAGNGFQFIIYRP